jgi:hypothetical protein
MRVTAAGPMAIVGCPENGMRQACPDVLKGARYSHFIF